MATAVSRSKLTALFKRGCHEIPDVMCSGFMALVGVVFLGFGCYRSVKYDVDNKVYKKFFTVYRPDDPRVKKIRNSIYDKYE